jgi:hypothetical protein
MLNVPVISQRDSRWKNVRLGTGDTTIGSHGCVLTSLTALAGKTDPREVNELMIKNNGFVDGDLVNWVNVPRALPMLKFQWRSWVYDNNQVANWVYTKKLPVIVEVDGAPIGSPKSSHFVIFLGDRKCMDPWTGKIEPTSKYPTLKGYILYDFNASLEARVRNIIYGNDSDQVKVQQLQSLLPK